MSDPLKPSIIERVSKNWISIAAVIAFSAALIWAFSMHYGIDNEVGHPEVHTVIGFAALPSDGPSTPMIRTKDSNGLEHSIKVGETIGRRCAVGDKIHVIRHGVSVNLSSEGCIRANKE